MNKVLDFNNMKIKNISAFIFCDDCKKPRIKFEGDISANSIAKYECPICHKEITVQVQINDYSGVINVE